MTNNRTMATKKQRVVVCGATGFIGRNIIEMLAADGRYEVIGVYHQRPLYELRGVEWIKADLTDPEDVNRSVSGADVVIQTAATTSGSKYVVERPYIHPTDNPVMNSLLLRPAFGNPVPLLFFTCVHVPPSDTPRRRTTSTPTAGARAAAAAGPTLYREDVRVLRRSGRTRHTVVRHSNIYGPHDKFDLERSHVFGATVTKVMTARDGKITVWGAGEEARDLLYVGDLVDFVQRAVERQTAPFALYNVGSGEAVPVKSLVRRIVAASGRALAIEHDLSKPTIPTRLCLDCRKAERELGWKSRTTLDDGIARTVAWWREHQSLAQASVTLAK